MKEKGTEKKRGVEMYEWQGGGQNEKGKREKVKTSAARRENGEMGNRAKECKKQSERDRGKDGCRETVEGERASEPARRGVKILSDQVHIIGLVNIHSFLRYSEG